MIASNRAWPVAAALGIFACAIPAQAAAQTTAGDVAAPATALSPGDYIWDDDLGADVAQPLSVLVSIADQRLYLFRGPTLVAVSTVSTGREGHETPTGSFTVLQKATMHRSNKYENAPMPYMERLTWDGIAIHGGVNPGYPASHGCVRVPLAFAKKLYGAMRLGATVTITQQPVLDPVEPATQAAPGSDAIEQSAPPAANGNAQAPLPPGTPSNN